MAVFERAVFGNRGGSHQLLSSSLPSNTAVLDTLRFLVDRPAGHVGAEVTWCPYWGCQGIDRWWVLWRGEEDQSAPRKNMITARVVLVPVDDCAIITDVDDLLTDVGYTIAASDGRLLGLAGSVVGRLASGKGPAIVADLSIAPLLIRAIWPRLWASARASLSLRTLFGVESLDSVSPSSIVIVPAELGPRWHGQHLIDGTERPDGHAAQWFGGNASPQLERLIVANAARLPGDLTVLDRVDRILGRLERLQAGTANVTDALVVLRTQEAFSEGFLLPNEDEQAITAALRSMERASVDDIRTASLVRLDSITDRSVIESALARWVETQLPTQSSEHALWIIEQQAGDTHAPWWRRGVGAGLDSGCSTTCVNWATAIWRWWVARPRIVSLLTPHLGRGRETEEWLAAHIPVEADDELVDAIADVCRERGWATLLARSLGSTRPLTQCVEMLRNSLPHPEAGLKALLDKRTAEEIVDVAAATCWAPLITEAAILTIAKPQLCARALGSIGIVPLLLSHLSQGGVFPAELLRNDFVTDLFDAVLKGNKDSIAVVQHLDRRAGSFVLDHTQCERLLPLVNSEVVQGTAEEWWRRFLADDSVGKPPAALCATVLKSVRSRISNAPITLVISLLQLFPEIPEAEFETWMRDMGFRWGMGDHERMAGLLHTREWRAAAKSMRWSWKRELNAVAWYAQDLLPWFERFWSPPAGVDLTSTSALTTNSVRATKRIDVGIITIKEEEYAAVLEKLAPAETARGNNRDYDVATVGTPQGFCRVAITRCVHQGNAHAQSTTTELLSDLEPGFVLVVGIAGGVPTIDFCLGDVVVSDYIQDLTYEDSGTEAGGRSFNALGGLLHPNATRIVERLRGIERTAGPWNQTEHIGVPRPDLAGHHTTDDSEWNADITAALQQHVGKSAPIAIARKIASSDRLIKDPELLKTWRKVLKAVSAVEMESAGVYIPCQRNNVPVLAIRGISDIVGWKRNNAWTRYACHAAAAYARMLIGAGVFGHHRAEF